MQKLHCEDEQGAQLKSLGHTAGITIRHETVEVLISGCGYQSHQSIKPILIQIADATAFTMKI